MTGPRQRGVRAATSTRGVLPQLAFTSRVISGRPNWTARPDEVSCVDGFETLQLRGQLSAGRRGCELSCRLLRKRRRLVLEVVAAQGGHTTTPDIEVHEFVASISGLAAGRYEVYVVHVFSGPGSFVVRSPEPRYVGEVTMRPAGVGGGPALP